VVQACLNAGMQGSQRKHKPAMDTRKLIEVNSDSGGNKPEWKAGVPQNQQCEETRGNELSHSFFFFTLY